MQFNVTASINFKNGADRIDAIKRDPAGFAASALKGASSGQSDGSSGGELGANIATAIALTSVGRGKPGSSGPGNPGLVVAEGVVVQNGVTAAIPAVVPNVLFNQNGDAKTQPGDKTAKDVSNESKEQTSKSEDGVIYKVDGKDTPSGKPYVGRTSSPDGPPGRGNSDGRDRSNAEVVDTYNTRQEGRVKEQRAIDGGGEVKELDNKRNEIAPENRKKNGLD